MIRVRIVADDVDQADAAALAIGRVLTVTRESPARPRRSGDGVTVYLDAELPPVDVDVDAADRADPANRCGRAGCGQYVPLDGALPVPTVDDGGVRYALVRFRPAGTGGTSRRPRERRSPATRPSPDFGCLMRRRSHWSSPAIDSVVLRPA